MTFQRVKIIPALCILMNIWLSTHTNLDSNLHRDYSRSPTLDEHRFPKSISHSPAQRVVHPHTGTYNFNANSISIQATIFIYENRSWKFKRWKARGLKLNDNSVMPFKVLYTKITFTSPSKKRFTNYYLIFKTEYDDLNTVFSKMVWRISYNQTDEALSEATRKLCLPNRFG